MPRRATKTSKTDAKGKVSNGDTKKSKNVGKSIGKSGKKQAPPKAKSVKSINPLKAKAKINVDVTQRKIICVAKSDSKKEMKRSDSQISSIIGIFEDDDINDHEKKDRLAELSMNIDGVDPVSESADESVKNNLPAFADRLRLWESMGPDEIVRARSKKTVENIPPRSKSLQNIRQRSSMRKDDSDDSTTNSSTAAENGMVSKDSEHKSKHSEESGDEINIEYVISPPNPSPNVTLSEKSNDSDSSNYNPFV